MKPTDILEAHKHSSKHKDEIENIEICGCFFCLAKFKPLEIEEWTGGPDSLANTALCPKCGIDSVIGSKSGYPIDEEFLGRMRNHWFS